MSYTARADRSGSAPLLAFTEAFAAEHPEFTEGAFDVHVISRGRLLVSLQEDGKDNGADDPVLGAFLGFLEKSMCEEPHLVQPMTSSNFAGLDEMLEAVEADLDAPLEDHDYELP